MESRPLLLPLEQLNSQMCAYLDYYFVHLLPIGHILASTYKIARCHWCLIPKQNGFLVLLPFPFTTALETSNIDRILPVAVGTSSSAICPQLQNAPRSGGWYSHPWLQIK